MDPRSFGALAAALAAAGLLASGCAPEPSQPSVGAIIDASPSLSIFAAALDAAELSGRLASGDTYTVFAPVNQAFEALPPEVLGTLLLPENQEGLRRVLRAHIVAGALPAAELAGRATDITAADGTTFLVDGTDGLTIRGGRSGAARVIDADLLAANGVVHVTDRVLLP